MHGEAEPRPEEAIIETYEVMLIVIPELDEEQVANTVGRFRTIISRTGGESSDPNFWGKRRLAYEVDGRNDAFYVVMEFTTGERTLVELKRILRVSDDVLRHMIVKLPADRPETGGSQQAESAPATPVEDPEPAESPETSEAEAAEPVTAE